MCVRRQRMTRPGGVTREGCCHSHAAVQQLLQLVLCLLLCRTEGGVPQGRAAVCGGWVHQEGRRWCVPTQRHQPLHTGDATTRRTPLLSTGQAHVHQMWASHGTHQLAAPSAGRRSAAVRCRSSTPAPAAAAAGRPDGRQLRTAAAAPPGKGPSSNSWRRPQRATGVRGGRTGQPRNEM